MNLNSQALKLKIKGYFGNSDMEIGSSVTDPIFITSFDFSPATPTVTDLNIPQQSRKVFVSNFQRDRTVSIEGVIIAYEYDTLEYYSQKLQRALYPDVNQVIEFTLTSLAGKDYQFEGVLLNLAMPNSPDNGQYSKKFQAQIKFDGVPFLKGLDLQTGLKSISVLGLEIPELGLEIPELGLEITDGNSGILTLSNSGNATTYPTWYFTGQGTNWTVTNTTSNKGSFVMGTSLTSFDIADGQTVIVDSLSQTVLQNGTSRDGFNVQNFEGLSLVAGTNIVDVSVASNNNANTQVSVEYFYYYQGI
jgi:hypothetical protein